MSEIPTGMSGETDIPNRIGRFKFGVGAIIKHPNQNNILVTKKANTGKIYLSDINHDIIDL